MPDLPEPLAITGDTVTLSRKDWDKLVVELDQMDDPIVSARVEAAVDRILRGEERTIPGDIIERLIGGAHPITVWREHRGLTQKDLATQVAISQPYLSALEAGKKDGTLDTLTRIARALDVDFDVLVDWLPSVVIQGASR